MRVLLACEVSGKVRDAFRARNHEAWSCDQEPSDSPYHLQCDVAEVLGWDWDLVIAFAPCTHLCSSGARWWPEKVSDGRQAAAVEFFLTFTRLSCRWAIENPIGMMSQAYREPDQIIQPWQFGHGEVKATCLWLNGVPKLVPTDIVEGREPRVHMMPGGPDRSRKRSETYSGVAAAMATQWSEPAGFYDAPRWFETWPKHSSKRT